MRMEVLQFPTLFSTDLEKEYALDSGSIINRLGEILSIAENSRNQLVGWVALKLTREYLSVLPVKAISSKDIKSEDLFYISRIYQLKEFLDNRQFCYACNHVADMVYFGAITNTGIRDAVLSLLTEHKYLNISRELVQFNAEKDMQDFLCQEDSPNTRGRTPNDV